MTSLKSPAHFTIKFSGARAAATMIVLVQNGPAGFTVVGASDVPALVLLALIPGLAAMVLYYRGLRTTPASAATLAELAFPVTAVAVGRFVFEDALTLTQWGGLVALTATLVTMSLGAQRGDASALGVTTPPRRAGVGPPKPQWSPS